jgi:hypothetical protein
MVRRAINKRKTLQTEDMQAHPPAKLSSTLAAQSISDGNWFDPWVCAIAALLSLLPFLSKAVHLDDTVFIYVAKQICQSPTDPFGLVINWYGHQMPLHEVQQNGPLASYYMALAASLLGWSEVSLHTAFLVPAVASAVGMFYLAKRLCDQPVLSTLIMLLSPAFLVSGTTLMCDVFMMALWLWSVVLWIWSADRHSHGWAILSAVLIGAGIVTKYYATAIIPLLLAYSLFRWHDVRSRVFYLLIPVAMVLAYDQYMSSLYGHSLLKGASDHAIEMAGAKGSVIYRIAVTLTFMGGCLAAILFYAPMLCSRRSLLAACGLCVLAALLLPLFLDLNVTYWSAMTNPQSLLFIFQFAIFLIGGAGILVLVGRDVLIRRDADSLLLWLWVAGTFIFCSILNWTVNGRSLLPMMPPVSLLLIRGLSPLFKGQSRRSVFWKAVPLGLTAALALNVAWADTWWANSARSAAQFFDSHGPFLDKRDNVYYTGHWGFQFYMDKLGFRALETNQSTLRLGDSVIFPAYNTNVPLQLLAGAKQVEHHLFPVHPFLATMRSDMGAGFYSNLGGPLPFVIGPVTPDRYTVLTVSDGTLQRIRIQQLEQDVLKNSNSLESRYQFGMALLAAGQVADAVDQLEIAMEIDPNNLAIQNDLAWILATLPQEYQQRQPEALQLALHINSVSGGQIAEFLDTLAAALAANRRYDEATATATKALELLKNDPRHELVQGITERVQLYKQHQPHHEKYPMPAN